MAFGVPLGRERNVGLECKKVPYVASETKRFEVSKDENSRERLEMLKRLQKDLEIMFPRVNVAVSVYGSLTKGKNLEDARVAESTDVDLHIMFDRDDLLKEHERLVVKNKEYQARYQNYLCNYFKGEINILKSRECLFHLREVADRYINRMVKMYGGIKLHIYYDEASVEDLYEAILKAEANRNWHDKTVSDQEIASYFHLDIGGKLRRYQEALVEKLEGMEKPERETLCKVIYEAMIIQERVKSRGSVPEAIACRFPKTFAEFKRMYGKREKKK